MKSSRHVTYFWNSVQKKCEMTATHTSLDIYIYPLIKGTTSYTDTESNKETRKRTLKTQNSVLCIINLPKVC